MIEKAAWARDARRGKMAKAMGRVAACWPNWREETVRLVYGAEEVGGLGWLAGWAKMEEGLGLDLNKIWVVFQMCVWPNKM
jgi:hypothetical protein